MVAAVRLHLDCAKAVMQQLILRRVHAPDAMHSRLDAVIRPTRPSPGTLRAQRTRCTRFAPRVWRVRMQARALVRTGGCARALRARVRVRATRARDNRFIRTRPLVRTGGCARRRLAARTATRRHALLQHAPHKWLQALAETAARARGGKASCAEHGLARNTAAATGHPGDQTQLRSEVRGVSAGVQHTLD